MLEALRAAHAANSLFLPVILIGVAVIVLGVILLMNHRGGRRLRAQISLELREFVVEYQRRTTSLGERVDILAAAQDEVEAHLHKRIDGVEAGKLEAWQVEVERKLTILGKGMQSLGVRR